MVKAPLLSQVLLPLVEEVSLKQDPDLEVEGAAGSLLARNQRSDLLCTRMPIMTMMTT